MGGSAADSAVGVASREAMMSGIDPIEICARCHDGGLEPMLGRTFFERIRDLFRPTSCYVCAGAGEVQRSLEEKRMDELVQALRQVMERAAR
jgi:hypothetical protein